MIPLSQIETLHVELSTLCQAACPFCARNDYGYKTRTDFPKINMSYDDWVKIIESAELPALKKIRFCGTYGDPFMNRDVERITEHCLDKWSNVVLEFSTNGGMRTSDWWASFGHQVKDKNVRVIFGIDGLSDTHSLHRVNVPFEKVIENAKAFIGAGGNATWMFLIFKHNEHQIDEARHISESLGFKKFFSKEIAKVWGFVFTSDTDGYWILPAGSERFPPKPEKYVPFVRSDASDFREQERIWESAGKQIDCSAIKNKGLYLSADGKLYPCCWIGQYPETYKYNNFTEVIGPVKNNALKYGLEEAMAWFDRVEASWKKNSIDDGVLLNCIGCTKNHFFQET